MAVCDQCGNDYDKTFKILQKDKSWTFDSFECAIEALACRVIGHGVEEDGAIYCCAHCAGRSGATELRDRA